MESSKQLCGIILSGGKSSRFGSDKGSFMFNGKPMIEYALELLKPFCNNIIISSNMPDLYEKYAYEIVEDSIKDIGPLGGIYSCLKKSKIEHNIILSCDTPFINHGLMGYLADSIQEGDKAIVPYHGDGFLEPLCSYYNTSLISSIEKAISDGNYKLMSFLNGIAARKLVIDDSMEFYTPNIFDNLNSLSDVTKHIRN